LRGTAREDERKSGAGLINHLKFQVGRSEVSAGKLFEGKAGRIRDKEGPCCNK